MSKVFQPGDYVAIHENPVWRDQSDFIIRAYLEKNKGRNAWEQLWAKRLDENRFSICCIPFFANDLALGDEVETDGNYVVQGVVKSSGQFTVRIWFGESTRSGIKDDVQRDLEKIGVSLEWSSANLLAVSAKDASQTQQVLDYCLAKQSTDNLMYETGQSEYPQK